MLNDPMADYIKRVCRFFAIIALIPLLSGFFGPFSAILGELLFILFFIALITLLIGTPVWMVRAARLPIPVGNGWKRALALGSAPVLFMITVVAFWPLFESGSFIGSLTRLTINRDHYDAIVAKARNARKPVSFKEDGDVTYSTDIGPPVLIVFNMREIRTEWGSIIYDPTGDVMLAKGWNTRYEDFFGPRRITMMFMRGMYGCRRLSGDYYNCFFDW